MVFDLKSYEHLLCSAQQKLVTEHWNCLKISQKPFTHLYRPICYISEKVVSVFRFCSFLDEEYSFLPRTRGLVGQASLPVISKVTGKMPVPPKYDSLGSK